MKESFLTYFSRTTCKIRLVDKDNSWFMKLIAFCLTILNALKITNIKDDPDTERDESFMGGYGTTIGTTIYDHPGWDWGMEPSPFMVHELAHAVQSHGPLMALRYVFNPNWRMFYESEAVQAEILCFPERARHEKWMKRRIDQFKKYGVSSAVLILQTLEKRIEEAEQGNPRTSAQVVWQAYSAWKQL